MRQARLRQDEVRRQLADALLLLSERLERSIGGGKSGSSPGRGAEQRHAEPPGGKGAERE